VIVTAQTFCQDSFVTCDIDHISACQLPPWPMTDKLIWILQ
jgi:hypothetical protein